MLIDDRTPPREGDRAPVDPNWRVLRWLVAAAVVGFGAAHTGGFIGFVLVSGAFAAVCKAVTEVVDYADGLREWRQ